MSQNKAHEANPPDTIFRTGIRRRIGYGLHVTHGLIFVQLNLTTEHPRRDSWRSTLNPIYLMFRSKDWSYKVLGLSRSRFLLALLIANWYGEALN